MPSFPVKSSQQLSDFLYPVTTEMASQLWKAAHDSDIHFATMAVKFRIQNRETKKVKPASILVCLTVEVDGNFVIAQTEEYHPRKDGKADMEFKSDYILFD